MAHLHSRQWARVRGAPCVHYGSDSSESETEEEVLERVLACKSVCTLRPALVHLMHILPLGHVTVFALLCLVQDQCTT